MKVGNRSARLWATAVHSVSDSVSSDRAADSSVRENTSVKPPGARTRTSREGRLADLAAVKGVGRHRQDHGAHVALERHAPVALSRQQKQMPDRNDLMAAPMSSARRRPRAATARSACRRRDAAAAIPPAIPPPAAPAQRLRHCGAMPLHARWERSMAAEGCRPTALSTSRHASGRSPSE